MTAIAHDAWLSAVVGHDVFKVQASPAPAGQVIPIASPDRHPAMYYAKIETHRVDVVRALASAGFYTVDVNVTLGRKASGPARPDATGEIWVGDAEPEHHEALLEIAATCFRYSRFHLDPLVPAETAHRIKREWVRSYVRTERGDRLFAAVLQGRPVGFLAALLSDADGRRAAVIDLIGVAPSCQRRGIGRALVACFIEHYREQCEWLRVGTQIANMASIRLYEALGFGLEATQYVMHMHVPARQG
jgi:ribosomal protein S18 acetylase RimI-like enzyme